MKRNILYGGLAAVVLISATSGMFLNGDGAKSNASDIGKNAEIWSTYGTYAVMQDPVELEKNEYQPVKMAPEIQISMAKGETEGGQIVFTAKTDISSFDLTAGELTCGEHFIPAENVKIYKQCYTYVQDDRTPMTTGWYPDLLLPLDLAKTAGETTVKQGLNQGITVEITTFSDSIPGVYSGNFTLTINGEKTNIPVSVQICDIDITASHVLTVDVGMYDKMSLGGDSSAETIRKYYDQMLDYRANILYMPFSTYGEDRFVDELLKYYNHPRVTYIGIPEEFSVFGQYVLAAARNSTPERILTDKLYTYDKANDEQDDYRKVVASVQRFEFELQNVIDTLVREEFFTAYDGVAEGGEFYTVLSESIKNVGIIETIGWRKEYDGLNITYVPHNEFGSGSTLTDEGGVEHEANRDVYEQKSANGKYLHYINGTGPWIGHGMPNYLSGLRYWGYNLQKNGIAGELSWSICEFAYVQQFNQPPYLPRNSYEDAFNFSSLQFCLDGQYVYSGSRYGVTGFLPSMRLASRRDGFEDYELIYRLGELYKNELMNLYGIDYDMRNVLDWVYRKAVSDVNYYNFDDSLLYEMRKNIVDLIMLAESDAKFMLSGVGFDGSEATIEFYVADGYQVNFCGETLSGNVCESGTGRKYSVKRNVNTGNDISIELEKDGTVFSFAAKLARNHIYTDVFGDGETLKKGIEARNDAVISADGEQSVSFLFKECELDDPADVVLEQDRYFSLTEEYFGCSIKDLYDVTLTFEVESEDTDVDFVLRMYMGADEYDTSYLVDAKGLYHNGESKREYTYTFLVDRLAQKYFDQYKNVNRLTWRTDNAQEAGKGYRLYKDMKITLKKISYTKNGRMGE